MQKFTFKRQDTGLFTDQQLNLACQQERLLPFINRVFSKANFQQQIASKNNTSVMINERYWQLLYLKIMLKSKQRIR